MYGSSENYLARDLTFAFFKVTSWKEHRPTKTSAPSMYLAQDYRSPPNSAGDCVHIHDVSRK